MAANTDLAQPRTPTPMGTPHRRARHSGESGFAMLLVFLMASVVAIMLFMEIPRVAMDAQRQKEQLLIMRGEQYKRAILVFFKDNKRWPTKIEELESLNNKRYLRKRFIDPMTGKDEWRMIHISNGMLTDSVVTKPPSAADPKNADSFQWGGSSIGVQAGMGQTPAGGASTVNIANRKRASDGQTLPTGFGPDGQPIDPNNPGTQPPGTPGAPGDPNNPQQPGVLPPGVVIPPGVPGQAPLQAGQYPGQTPQYPGQTPQYPGQTPQYPGQTPQFPGQVPQYPGQVPQVPGLTTAQYPGQPAQAGQPGQYPTPIQPYPNQFPGQPVNSQTGQLPYPTSPGANGYPPGYPQPGNPINPQVPNQAQQMIQNILTTPRPGGMPTNSGQPQTIGVGIAGVASNADGEGIMVYGDRTNYKEWEFIFDPNKWRAPPNPLSGNTGTPASQMGNIGGSQIGTPVTSMPGAGTNPGFGGGGPGFGGSPGIGGVGGTTPPPRQQ
jgi:hypothetical protein